MGSGRLGRQAAFLTLTGGLLAACGGGGAGGGEKRAQAASPPKEIRSVRVVAAVKGTLPKVVTVTGTLAAEEQVVLGFKVAGRLGEIHVDLGSRAAKGEALARLAPVDFQLRVRQAEAILEQARSRLGLAPDDPGDRIDPVKTSIVKQAGAVREEAQARLARARALAAEQLLARSELDAAEAAYQVADGQYHDALEEVLSRQALLSQRRFELDLARQQLTDSVLRAPFDGAVRERQATPGEFIAAGQPVVTLVRVDPLRLKVAVRERDAEALRPGQAVELTVEGDAKAYPGRVARLSPAIEESSRTLQVEAEVPNPEGILRPGSFASASIVTAAAEPVVFVPASSIVTFAGIEKVLVVEGGKTVEKAVRTGRRHEDRVEVLEGIAAGESVVIEPGSLAGGESVTVAS